MEETQYDEIKVESVDEGTDFHDISHANDNYKMGLPKGYQLTSPNNVYIIEKVLGYGSFGITYMAQCNGRKVAIKEFFMHQFCGRMSSSYDVTGSSPGNQIEYYGNKFKQEAANLMKLKHDNIIKVFETFSANNTFYYSMEYIEGQSLESYIRHCGVLPEEEAHEAMLVICDAVRYLHSRKMLHLDLKPSNVMRSSSGEFYVIDFGLSKQFDEQGEPESSSNIGLGTPGYAPTEQIEHNGKTFAPWIDVYALGGIYYKMLTGKTPPTASEVLNIGLPVEELRKHGVSKPAITLIKSMMEPVWKKRIQDVYAVIDKLPLTSPILKKERLRLDTRLENDLKESVADLPENGGKGVDFNVGILSQFIIIAGVFLLDFVLLDSLIESIVKGKKWELLGWAPITFAVVGTLIAWSLLAWSKWRKALRIELIILCLFFIVLRIARIDWGNIDFLQSSFTNRVSGVGEVTFSVGDVKFTMIPVEPGSFIMGGDGFEHDGDVPHRVTITKKYFLGETEVTEALWKAVMGTFKNSDFDPELPVTHVNYEEALDFISKLNERLGLKFRLPTEAEWEFAARGGNNSMDFKYGGSDDVAEVAWYQENAHSRVHHVATKMPNELGFYDMTGNVAEWCSDYYVQFTSDESIMDPDYGDEIYHNNRVARGGSYKSPSHVITAKFHDISYFDYHPEGSGLRLALSMENNRDMTPNSEKASATQTTTDSSSDRTFTVNGVTFKMVRVEGGTFRMGSSDSDADSDEQPVHSVTLSGYYIGETEVTQALWEAVMGNNPSYFKGANLPVEDVSWNDCQDFIRELNRLTGKRFRLPTEAEWEFAVRGGNRSTGAKYSGSNAIANVAWYTDNSGSKTHPVKGKSPNELGLYDMSGNVWEWCEDRYGSYSSGSQTNPKGASSGSNRVLRGGSWFVDTGYCRVANRSGNTLTGRNYYLGLRLAL